MEVSAAEIRTGSRRKRIRGRFRATLAGLLELEVLRVRHKEMVEVALETRDSPDHVEDHEGRYEYWVEESSFRLKLKHSLSHENLRDVENPRTFLDLRRTRLHPSAEDLQDLYSRECGGMRSRLCSGFCDSHNDAMSGFSSSLASLRHQSADSSAGYRPELHTDSTWRSRLLKNRQEHVRKGDSVSSCFSQVVIPETGFLSVVDLYPDSHWPDISDILQPQVILEPSYRSDLRSHQGSEVYRYPSPLHAVALQSPLYAPQSPEHKKKSKRCSPGSLVSNTNSLVRSDVIDGQRRVFDCTRSHPVSPTAMQPFLSLTSSPAPLENPRCEEIILKRALGGMWNHTMAERSGNTSWSLGKSRISSSFKSMPFQKRATGSPESGPPTSSQASSPGFRGRLGTQKNRIRRHTAALTNLNIFTESNGTLCARTSAETKFLRHRRSSEAPQVFIRETSGRCRADKSIC